MKFEILAIPWLSLSFQLFIIRGGGPMIQTPSKGPPPPRPRRYFRAAEIRHLARKRSAARQIYSPLSATAKICSLGRTRTLNTDKRQCSSIYLLKNGTEKILSLCEQPHYSVRTLLGCCSICLQKVFCSLGMGKIRKFLSVCQ